HFAGEDLLNDGKAEILRQRDDGAPRNARQDGGAQRRRVKNVVANQEKVLAAAFAQVSLGVERDALAVALGDRFHLDQLRVRVVRRRLRQRGERVRVRT